MNESAPFKALAALQAAIDRQHAAAMEAIANTQRLQIEFEAMRLALTGVMTGLCRVPVMIHPIKEGIAQAVEIDAGVMLGSPASDEYMQRRGEHLRRMLPPILKDAATS